MKMIDVYMKMARFEVELGTKLVIGDYTFEYVEHWSSSEACFSYGFEDEKEKTLEDYYDIDLKFLNKVIELIPQKEKEYLIRLVLPIVNNAYLNLDRLSGELFIQGDRDDKFFKTRFTKSEMVEIKLVKEFLEKMNGKLELIEVSRHENY